MGHVGQHLLNGLNTHHVHWVVQRSDGIALLDNGLHFIIDQHALAESLATMHHTVTHGVNLIKTLDASRRRVGQRVEDRLDGTGVVIDLKICHFLGAVGKFLLDEGTRQTNLLYAALSTRLIGLNLNQFVFHRTAAAVQN